MNKTAHVAAWIMALAIGLAAAPLPARTAPEMRKWEALGAQHRNEFSGQPQKKAMFIAGLVAERLAQDGVKPNADVIGRAGALATHGDQAAGTCGDVAEVMRNAFVGAGFAHHEMFKLVVRKSGLNQLNRGWVFDVNIEHVVFGAVVDGKPVVFEAWGYGGENGSFAGFYKSVWNGMDLHVWLATMRKHGYDTYSYGDDHFRPVDADRISNFLRKLEFKGSSRPAKRPTLVPGTSPGGGDDTARVESEFRSLYPLWLRKRDDPTSVTTVLVNARREGDGRYFISIETRCRNAQGASWVCASRTLYMTLADLRESVQVYKRDLGR